MSTGGGGDAAQAARINQELAGKYAAVGLPAVQGSLGYASGALGQPLPRYATSAFRQAGTTALEAGAARTGTARAALMQSLTRAGGGGPALAGLTQVETGGAKDLATEVGSIGATNAMANIEQRNKLLTILTGGGASATDLAAGFGNLNTRALGVLGADPGAYPYIVGGTAALSGALMNYLTKKPPLGGGGTSAYTGQA